MSAVVSKLRVMDCKCSWVIIPEAKCRLDGRLMLMTA